MELAVQGYLVLENGRVFKGKLLNDCLLAEGEVVFSTAIASYQDIITDPSYYGQIVVMTYPLVGNVGFNEKSFASHKAMVQGLVMREATDFPSHYEMDVDLISFLNKSEVAVLTEVDTRALTRFIRKHGSMGAVITCNLDNMDLLIKRAKNALANSKGDIVQFVSRKNVMQYGNGDKRIILFDLGTKKGVINSLIRRNATVIMVPANTSYEEILRLNPSGLFISDGPGNPATIPYVVDTCAALIGEMPLIGVGLGHQVIAIALGAKTYKLPFGHRGSNQPVKDLTNNRVYITTQNHSFSLDEGSFAGTDIVATMRNLNDNTIEGIRHNNLPIFSVQFDPEGYPGYSDTGFIYDDFLKIC